MHPLETYIPTPMSASPLLFYKNSLDLIHVLYYYYKKVRIGVIALVFLFFLTYF